MNNKHNKKRNVGIVYELLLRHVSSMLIEGDKESAEIATKIIEKRFAKETELYKEFRLFNALAKTTVKDTELAAAILVEAKSAVGRFNNKRLESEKSALIRDINYKINDKSFYYRTVPDYPALANIHNMISEWKKGDSSNLKKVVLLEQKTLSGLLNEKLDKSIGEIKKDIEVNSPNRLVEKIMTEKINKKYSGFSDSQREILQKYALYSDNVDDHSRLRNFLQEKKKETLSVLNKFSKLNENKHVSNKINLVEKKIKDLDVEELNDSAIAKFLTLTSLVEEIRSEE
tara:strand:- start:331 stop:1191 length:861 start_codon:yes stop_codon:yes gene_type:complete